MIFNKKEYISCTKSIEKEEPLDFLVYRPLAYIVVKLTYFLPFTPNVFSLLALISALIAGFLLMKGEAYFFWGGFFIFMFSVFDCCDGMLARLKKNGSFYGELIDMLVDLFSNIAFFLGLYWGMAKHSHFPAAMAYLVFVAAFFILFHASLYRFYRTQYEFYLAGNPKGRSDHLKVYKDKLDEVSAQKGRAFEKFILRFYLFFSDKQKCESKVKLYPVKKYIQFNKLLVPLWGAIAGTSHLFILAVSLMMGEVQVYLMTSIIFFNLLLVVIWTKQKKIYRKMESNI